MMKYKIAPKAAMMQVSVRLSSYSSDFCFHAQSLQLTVIWTEFANDPDFGVNSNRDKDQHERYEHGAHHYQLGASIVRIDMIRKNSWRRSASRCCRKLLRSHCHRHVCWIDDSVDGNEL